MAIRPSFTQWRRSSDEAVPGDLDAIAVLFHRLLYDA